MEAKIGKAFRFRTAAPENKGIDLRTSFCAWHCRHLEMLDVDHFLQGHVWGLEISM